MIIIINKMIYIKQLSRTKHHLILQSPDDMHVWIIPAEINKSSLCVNKTVILLSILLSTVGMEFVKFALFDKTKEVNWGDFALPWVEKWCQQTTPSQIRDLR